MTNPYMPPQDRPAPREQVRDRVLLVVVLTVFLDLIGFGITIPLLPFYAKSMNASGQVVGFILSSYSAAQLLATSVLGSLSDKYGRRPIILISLAGNAASMLIFAAATHYKLLYLLFASVLEEAIRISEQEPERLVFQDQCALNIAFAGKVLWQLPGVRETRTYAVMEEVKSEGPLPL